MDQYVRWYGRKAHHEFYTAPEIRQAYKNWVQHLVTRVNTVNGKTYRDDPAIFAWELGNEPRCKGTGPGAPGWDLTTIPTWVAEMSGYIKSLDPNHMVSIGDEGFLNGGGEHWAYKANDGVDHEAMTAVPTIDFGTFHMYPEDWGAKLEWGERWIVDHLRVARRLGKPTILEEYGIKIKRDDQGVVTGGLEERLHNFGLWNETALQRGGNASMIWMLSGKCFPADGCEGSPVYKDYDRYTVYNGDESASLLSRFAKTFAENAPACSTAGGRSSKASPFVRVRKPGEVSVPAPVAMGWGPTDG
jgi:mannan endo-1,4-beta-mannosidase